MRCARETPVARERLALAALLAAALALAPSHTARAAESRGALRLLGTVVSSDTSRSLAVIEHGGAPRVLRTGSELDGAQVVEIRAESVLLRRGALIETLRLASASQSEVHAVSTFPASPADVQEGEAPSDTRAAHAARAQSSSPRARRASRLRGANSAPARAAAPSEADVARTNDELMADLASQARFAPVMGDDGKLRGVAVMNILSDSLLERLGLRSDDVITAIQGTKVDSSGRAMSVARSLNRTQPVRLDLERRGVPSVVVVDPSSLQRR